MARINETHPLPVHHASVGHAHLHLYGPHSGPVELATPNQGSDRRLRRAQAKAAVQARRAEVQSGASFLRKLTTQRAGNG